MIDQKDTLKTEGENKLGPTLKQHTIKEIAQQEEAPGWFSVFSGYRNAEEVSISVSVSAMGTN